MGQCQRWNVYGIVPNWRERVNRSEHSRHFGSPTTWVGTLRRRDGLKGMDRCRFAPCKSFGERELSLSGSERNPTLALTSRRDAFRDRAVTRGD
jgi:hypothetical protein